MNPAGIALQRFTIPCNQPKKKSVNPNQHAKRRILTLRHVFQRERVRVVAPVQEPDQYRAGLGLVNHVVAAVAPPRLVHVEGWLGKFQVIAPAGQLIVQACALGGEVGVAKERRGKKRCKGADNGDDDVAAGCAYLNEILKLHDGQVTSSRVQMDGMEWFDCNGFGETAVSHIMNSWFQKDKSINCW